jgi:hypothetical protein
MAKKYKLKNPKGKVVTLKDKAEYDRLKKRKKYSEVKK